MTVKESGDCLLHEAEVKLLEAHQPQLKLVNFGDIDGLLKKESSHKAQALGGLDGIREAAQRVLRLVVGGF